MKMKTIHMVFLGGPGCGAMRVLPGPIPSIRIPMPPGTATFTEEGAETRMSDPPRSYCYTLTEERDHAGRFVYRYVGEQ